MTIVFEQGLLDEDGELVRRARLFTEYKRPRVRCVFVAREVDDVRFGALGDAPFYDVEYVQGRGEIEFSGDELVIAVRRLDLSVEVTDEVVGYDRIRHWSLGPLGIESIQPW